MVAVTTVGTGNDTISLYVSEDAYQGDAQFTISVDGAQIGGVQTTQAQHASGQNDVFNVLGDFGIGPHTVTVDFLNDAYGGTPGTDRNLYVDRIVRGVSSTTINAALYSAGPRDFSVGATLPPFGPVTIGSGPDSLVLEVSGDTYYKDGLFYPLFTISVDGVQVGGVQYATASHTSGPAQAFTVLGRFAPGPHAITLDFLNDAYGGTPGTDRNLYLDRVTNGGLVTQTRAAILSQGTFSVDVPAPAQVIAGSDITGPDSGYAVLNGTAGDDTIRAHGGGNTINGQGGSDTVAGGEGGGDTITVGALRDRLTSLNETVTIAGANNAVAAGDAAVTLSGTASGTVATLGDGDNTVRLDGVGHQVSTGSGRNTLALIGGGAQVRLTSYYTPNRYSDDITFTGTGNSVQAGLNQGKYPASGAVTINGGSGGGNFALGWGSGVVHTDGPGNVVSFGVGTFDVSPGSGYDTVIASGFPAPSVGTIHLAGPGNTVEGSGASLTVTGGDGGGTFNLNPAYISVPSPYSIVTGGEGNVFNLRGVTAAIDAGSGSDTVSLFGSRATLVFHGSGNLLFMHPGGQGSQSGPPAPVATVADQSSDLQTYVDNASASLTFSELGAGAVVHLLGGNGGYATPGQALAALTSDGAGGTLLPLTNGTIDFAAGIQLGAGNFAIG